MAKMVDPLLPRPLMLMAIKKWLLIQDVARDFEKLPNMQSIRTREPH
jgi:hypothetical protein